MATFVDIDCPHCGRAVVTELLGRAGKSIIHCPHCSAGCSVSEDMFVCLMKDADYHECPCCRNTLRLADDGGLVKVYPSPNRERMKVVGH